ncbi:hypothetical protein D6C90_01579 [Aureobasidium pullulans]|uniref:Apple domain-containing protein n=1 Tax=Aureobasidium pullulans TaxID=5580 RepID=A0A4S9VIF4_AURPU|nr:hypothetical protein D6C90_01579 [Aureobasidium pullulans]
MHFSRILLPIVSLVSLAASSPLQHGRRGDTATSSVQVSATSTTSSSTACPTTPEEGTYCGFINPEDPCAPQPGGQGPTMVPDTVDTFINYKPFQSISLNNTYAPGYTTIFKNLTSAAKNPNNYIGLYYLDTYDVSACAAKCNEVSTCNSFNIYIERDPSVNPTKNDSTAPTVWGYWCPNPSSLTNYKCALWGDGIYNSSATNHGQHRGDFEVVIAGSNAFVKNGFFNSTTYSSGSGVVPTMGMPSPSAVVSYTGAASGVSTGLSVLGGCAVVLAMLMAL